MKKKALRFGAALGFAAVACIIISFIYIVTVRATVREKLNNITDEAMKNCVASFEENIKKDFNFLKGYDNTQISTAEIPSDYDGIGYFTVENGKKVLDYKITTAVFDDDNIMFSNTEYDASDRNIFKVTIEGKDYIAYSYKKNNHYNLFFVSANEFAKRVSVFNFDNVIIINQSDRIVYSAVETSSGFFNSAILKNDFNYVNTDNGKNLVLYSSLNSFGVKLVTYTSSAVIENYINNTVTYTLILVIVLILIILAACAFLLLLTIKGDYKAIYKEGRLYYLKIDNIGKIVSMDKAFKNNFDIESIFEYICEKEDLNSKLYNGVIILKVADKNNQIRYLNFKSNFDGVFYRLIGNDITNLYNELLETKKMLNCNVVTGLQHDIQFEKDYNSSARKSYFETFAVVAIEITNASQLRTMFGNDSYYKMQKIVSDKLLEFYTSDIKVYFSIEELFILFADSTLKAEGLIDSLNKNLEQLHMPIHVNDNVINLVCKAGINKITEITNHEEALRHAKVALKYAKLSKNKNYNIYDSRIMKSAFALYENKSSILELINSNKFNIYYQPQYSLKQNKIVGFEALTRFTSPELKNISVQEFFEVAEKNGAIIEMGTAIYERAMEFAKTIEDKNATISLNVSPIQLLQEGFSEKFIKKFNSLGLKPESICVEITESFLMQSYDDIINKLLMLQNNGILIHLDDFGTAYSSMLYLNKLPIDALKIDREFVRDILINSYSKTIVGFIINLSKDLKLSCVIEGVENIEQSDIIKELGGEIIQGYYISKAVPPEEALQMLDEGSLVKKRGKI